MNRYLLYCFLFLFSAVAVSGSVTGKIQVVAPNTAPGWNGVMIQMANDKIVDSSCGNNSWALIKVENELDKVLVSVVLTAKATQEFVRVFIRECSTPPATIGTIPIVESIDLGIRN